MYIKKSTQKKEKGFTLVEIVIAIVLLTFGTLVVMQLFPAGLKLNTRSRNFSEAVFLAQGKMEELIYETSSVNTSGSGIFSDPFSRFQYSYSKEPFNQDPDFSVIKVIVTGPDKEKSTLCALIRGSGFEGIDADFGLTVIWVVNKAQKSLACFEVGTGAFQQLPSNLLDQNNAEINPRDVAVDGAGEKIFIVDKNNKKVVYNTVSDINSNNNSKWKVVDPPGGGWNEPIAVDTDFTGEVIWVADAGSKRLWWYNGTSWEYQIISGTPADVAVNMFGDIAWVSDKENKKILCYDGSIWNSSPVPGGGVPGAIFVDAAGQKVYVVNTTSNSINVFESDKIGGTGQWNSESISLSNVQPGSITMDFGTTVLWLNDLKERRLRGYNIFSGDTTGTSTGTSY